MGRKLGIFLAVAAFVAATASTASAATTLYAAPADQGTHDCSSPANACVISTAVTVAASGDTIDMLGNLGSYNLAAATINPGPKTLHFVGTNGQPRLIGHGFPYVLKLTAPASTASNLYVENDDPANGGGISLSPSSGAISADRIFVKVAGSTAHPCYLGGGVTLTNSVCWQSNAAASDLGIETDGANTLRNDVAWVSGGGVGIRCFGRSGVAGNDTLINTIVRVTGSGAHDLAANSDGVQSATLNVSYSNFGTTIAEGTSGLDHFNTDASDQIAAPALVNPNAGDFHELSTSPTINAGVTSAANGTLDLDGNPRIVNGKTDIGAYEQGTPGVPTLTPPHGTTLAKSKIKRHKHRATFTFTGSGTVTGFQCALIKPTKKGKHHNKPKLVFSSCSSPKTYRHLKHGKYTFEVRAVNAAGADPSPAITHFKI